MIIAQAETMIDSAAKLVDRAAMQNDRWLFLAALVILLAFVAFVIRWLVSHIQEKDRTIAEKERLTELSRSEARVEFLNALAAQRADFRAELQAERAAVVSSLTRLAEVTMEHVKEARAVWRERLPQDRIHEANRT